MSNYNLQINWSGKDALSDSDPDKVISGTDFNTEYTAVKTAVNSKADLNGDSSESFSASTAPSGTNTTQVATTAFVKTALEALHPVGSIYTNATNSTNPATLLGFGTWVAFGAGRVMVGLDSGDTDFDTAEETGGSKTHTLTVNEIPEHTHNYDKPNLSEAFTDGTAARYQGTTSTATTSTGGGAAHNNVQPYITVYMWKRTA